MKLREKNPKKTESSRVINNKFLSIVEPYELELTEMEQEIISRNEGIKKGEVQKVKSSRFANYVALLALAVAIVSLVIDFTMPPPKTRIVTIIEKVLKVSPATKPIEKSKVQTQTKPEVKTQIQTQNDVSTKPQTKPEVKTAPAPSGNKTKSITGTGNLTKDVAPIGGGYSGTINSPYKEQTKSTPEKETGTKKYSVNDSTPGKSSQKWTKDPDRSYANPDGRPSSSNNNNLSVSPANDPVGTIE